MRDKYEETAEHIQRMTKASPSILETKAENSVYAICARTTDHIPNIPSEQDECHLCNHPVWITATTRKIMANTPRDADIICIDCWLEKANSGKEKMVFVTPTKEQVEEIRRYAK